MFKVDPLLTLRVIHITSCLREDNGATLVNNLGYTEQRFVHRGNRDANLASPSLVAVTREELLALIGDDAPVGESIMAVGSASDASTALTMFSPTTEAETPLPTRNSSSSHSSIFSSHPLRLP